MTLALMTSFSHAQWWRIEDSVSLRTCWIILAPCPLPNSWTTLSGSMTSVCLLKLLLLRADNLVMWSQIKVEEGYRKSIWTCVCVCVYVWSWAPVCSLFSRSPSEIPDRCTQGPVCPVSILSFTHTSFPHQEIWNCSWMFQCMNSLTCTWTFL